MFFHSDKQAYVNSFTVSGAWERDSRSATALDVAASASAIATAA